MRRRITEMAIAVSMAVGITLAPGTAASADDSLTTITADITRAYATDPATGAAVTDPGGESPLSNVVADAWHEGIYWRVAEPDLALVDPRDLGADLEFAGDGVITAAEAAAVLPENRELVVVDLTGDELKAVLEQQWQATDSATPFIALGLSKNVSVSRDATRPPGSRITTIWVNGLPVDPWRVYQVAMTDALAGSDHFDAITQGVRRNLGVFTRDTWHWYLYLHQGLAPSFALRQPQAQLSCAPLTPACPSEYTLTSGLKLHADLPQLDMTARGALPTTQVEVLSVSEGGRRVLTQVPVTGGATSIDVTVPPGRVLRMVALPSGTRLTRVLTRTTPTISVRRLQRPKRVVVDKTRARFRVSVGSINGGDVAGRVVLSVAGRSYRAVLNPFGQAKIRVTPFRAPGRHVVTVQFPQTGYYLATSVTTQVKVVRPKKVTGKRRR